MNPVDDIEAALVKLQPRRATVNRDRLLFLAGKAAGAAERASVPSSRRSAWPLATFASVAAMLVFAVLFGIERGRSQSVRTVVKHDPSPAAVLPNRSLRMDGPAKQAARTDVVTDVHSTDSLATESRLMRLRHPALMTDADLLPNTVPTGGRQTANPLSVGDTRRAMGDGLSATRAKPAAPSGLPSILNQFRFGRGGL